MSELENNFHKFKDLTKEEFFIAEEIKKHLDIKDTDTILDIGCADGNLSKSLTRNSTNITFLDINEFDFSPQEKFIHSSFEEAEIDQKYDIILSSHVWGHFYRNNSFDFCFKKALDLLKENGKLIVVHNSNKDFTGNLIDLSKTLFTEVEFDVFLDEFLRNVKYSEYYFDVNLQAETFRELAELIQVLLIVPDMLYYAKIDEIIEFLEKNLEKPEFPINQKLLIIEKNSQTHSIDVHTGVYQPLYEEASVYQKSLEIGVPCFDIRPLGMLMETVVKDGQPVPRFQPITDRDVISKLKRIRNQMYGHDDHEPDISL